VETGVNQDQDLVNRLNLLLEINASINSTRSLDELLSKITNTTSVIMRAEASSIALLDNTTDELVFQFVHGSASDTVRTIRVPVGKGISGWVAKYGVPLIVPDAHKDPRFNGTSDAKSNFVTKSVICVPLIREGKVVGILQSLNKKDGGVFSNEDLTIFESLASIASIAIENAQLYELLNQRLQQLEEAKQRNEYILNQLKRSEEETEKLKELSKTSISGAFSGKLDVFRVENLVQMLGNDYKTGRLTLHGPDDEAYIYLQDGKLKHVEFKNRELSGINAFYETICWQEGSFSFENDIPSPGNTIDKMSMGIIIEGLRRLDESNVLQNKYTTDMVPRYTFESENTLKPDPNDTPKIAILKKINGVKTVGDLLLTSSLDRYSVLSSIKELCEDNMITFETNF
jgi:putative methionine-R-sulfoxide reductase with GAF domain